MCHHLVLHKTHICMDLADMLYHNFKCFEFKLDFSIQQYSYVINLFRIGTYSMRSGLCKFQPHIICYTSRILHTEKSVNLTIKHTGTCPFSK